MLQRSSRFRALATVFAALGAAILLPPPPAQAGTGRLLSRWLSFTPQVDGAIAAGEWAAASTIYVGDGVTIWLGNDARTLYFGVRDALNTELGPGDFVVLWFDDEGGAAPVLDDSAFANPGCQQSPNLGEGLLLFSAEGAVELQEWVMQGTSCTGVDLDGRIAYRVANPGLEVIFEAAIPLDGPSPLRAGAGRRFGLRVQVFRDGAQVACLPDCAAQLPPDFRNLILASAGCNTGILSLDSGLPLDWKSQSSTEPLGGWRATGPSGDPVFCDEPAQGPGGSAACVSNFHYGGGGFAETLLEAPFPVWGQEHATVRFLGTLVQGDPFDLFSIRISSGGSAIATPLLWQESRGPEIAAVNLNLLQEPYLSSPPDGLSFYQATLAAGVEGGFAQADNVELVCGPGLFSDGFESGLTTHWSAALP